jgi:hypothetical protein
MPSVEENVVVEGDISIAIDGGGGGGGDKFPLKRPQKAMEKRSELVSGVEMRWVE